MARTQRVKCKPRNVAATPTFSSAGSRLTWKQLRAVGVKVNVHPDGKHMPHTITKKEAILALGRTVHVRQGDGTFQQQKITRLDWSDDGTISITVLVDDEWEHVTVSDEATTVDTIVTLDYAKALGFDQDNNEQSVDVAAGVSTTKLKVGGGSTTPTKRKREDDSSSNSAPQPTDSASASKKMPQEAAKTE